MVMKRDETTVLSRRSLIGSAVAAIVAGRAGAATLSASKQSATVSIENFSPAGVSLGVVEVARVVKTDDEWRKQLSGASYHVTRREGTEPAFSGALAKNHEDGLYQCICCDTTLYDSKTKFESGTGWPSFWQPISKKNVVESADRSFGMVRTAVSCRRCDAHLGHVFEDGPPPTGLRYCMNSVALKFVRRSTWL
jgi:peptide-methionine (R)-S-oxide reductase